MTDANTIASRYIDLWNERTPDRRRAILSRELGQRRPICRPPDERRRPRRRRRARRRRAAALSGFPLSACSAKPNGFGDHVRFSWGLGPDGADSPIKGTDFAVLSDGRIKSITGFLDQVPHGA